MTRLIALVHVTGHNSVTRKLITRREKEYPPTPLTWIPQNHARIAATTSEESFFQGEMPKMSSRSPMLKTMKRAGRRRRTRGNPSQTIAPEFNLTARSRPYAPMTEANMARPPIRGIGAQWIFRFRSGLSMIPKRHARFLTSGVRRSARANKTKPRKRREYLAVS